ncbi:MAG: zf-HC2 domain-containing protein [Acidimicrobiales bacterium]
MNRLAHRRLQRAVSAFVDGELDADAAAVVAAHLRECWECSGEADLARLMKASLRQLRDRDEDALAAMRLRRFASQLAN